MPYSVIVFDLGNVLIPFDYSIAIAKLNSYKDSLGEKFMSFYKDNYHIHRDFEKGVLSNEQFLSIMINAVDNIIDKETFCNLYSKIFTVNEDVANLLPLLKEKYLLVLLSNTNDIHREYGWKNYPFLKYFDRLILSHEVGAVKPEEKIYKAVEAFTKKPPSEHIFIDDIKEYAEGAKKMGWDAIQFTGYENLKRELISRKILI